MSIPLSPSRIFLLLNGLLMAMVVGAVALSAMPEALKVSAILLAMFLMTMGSLLHCRHHRGVIRLSDEGLRYGADVTSPEPVQLVVAGGWSHWLLGVEIRLPGRSFGCRRYLLFLPDNISANDWRRLRIYLRDLSA